MDKRRLGDTDLFISPIGFGAWAIGGEWAFGWGPQDDADSIAAIRRAVELGINWIDTAAIYGFGRSEEVVGKALSAIPSGSRPYVFTKCSMLAGEGGMVHHSLKADSIRRELEDSLRRLAVDVIDLYQIHWPSFPPGNPDAPDVEEGFRTLFELKKEGKVRHIGVSNFTVSQLDRIGAIAKVGSLQPPYSMLMRGVEDGILPYAAQHEIGVIVYSPMQSGLLTGAVTKERLRDLPESDWRKHNQHFQEPNLSRNLEVVEKLREIGGRHGRSPGEVAIAWTLRRPEVTGAIVGARRASQVDGFIGAMDFRLSAGEIEEIARVLPPTAGFM